MPIINDAFPPAALNATYWTAGFGNDGSIVVGSPSNGVYPQNLDMDGDSVAVSSANKLIVPGVLNFDMHIYYEDVYTVAGVNIVSLLSWYSMQLDMSGDPAYGISILLCAKPDPEYLFQQVIQNQGAVYRTNLITDPSSGANGGFRIQRTGSQYMLYRYDVGLPGWVLLSTETLGHVGPGFIVFGQFAENTEQQGFPWVFQT